MTLKIPHQFETKRLILRSYRKGDGKEFFDMVQNGNREHLKDILGYITETQDINKIESWIQDLASDWDKNKRFVLSYWQKETITFLGHIWIEPIDWKEFTFEIGWFIDKNYQGKGYATEAAKKALEITFKDLRAQKVMVSVREQGPYTEKSKKIAERCGFIKIGISHDSIKLEDGTLICETQYTKLKKDYYTEKN